MISITIWSIPAPIPFIYIIIWFRLSSKYLTTTNFHTIYSLIVFITITPFKYLTRCNTLYRHSFRLNSNNKFIFLAHKFIISWSNITDRHDILFGPIIFITHYEINSIYRIATLIFTYSICIDSTGIHFLGSILIRRYISISWRSTWFRCTLSSIRCSCDCIPTIYKTIWWIAIFQCTNIYKSISSNIRIFIIPQELISIL
jgi:hypothetical protein